MDLTPREQDVLLTIIEHYIETAKPVASRTVAKRSGLGLSPASMRSVMADLTDKGLLEQPHTSAGRVPTAAAFRAYVDVLLATMPRAQANREFLETRLSSQLGRDEADLAELLRRAGRILSDTAQQVSMVVAPSYSSVRLKKLDFVLVKPRLILAILVLHGGIVQQKLIQLDEDATADDLQRYANYVAEKFAGKSLAEIHAAVALELSRDFSRLGRRALSVAGKAFRTENGQEIFVDGAAHLLRQPALVGAGDLHEVLSLLDERSRLLAILDKVMHAGAVSITMGTPSLPSGMGDVSLVSSPYGVRGNSMGVVSVLGPMNMDYATVVPTVEMVAALITNMLHKRF